MRKKIKTLFIVLCIFSIAGCGYSSNTKDTAEKVDNKETCSINNNSKEDCFINKSLICPQFKDIANSGTGFFITNSGELYEYSTKKYSVTNNNCKKTDTDILFDKIIKDTLVSKDGDFYSLYEGKLKKITDDEIEQGPAWYGISQMDIKTYKENNKIFYLANQDINGPDIYGYINGNSIYSNSYDYSTKKRSEKMLITFKDDEKVERITNGFIITNKGYYKYGITNKKECSEYEDVKCEYGLILVDTIENCSDEIFYISNNLIITYDMIK